MRHDEFLTHNLAPTAELACQFYQFLSPPFTEARSDAFVFAHARAQAVLRSLHQGVETRQGLVVCLGEAGLGKTTLLHTYLETVVPQRLKAIVLSEPPETFHDFLTLLSQELGIEHPTDDRVTMIFRLRQALLEEYNQQRNVACFIDDAHALPIETLAQVVTLAHLDTGAGKLLQVVLVGRPALQHMLKHPAVHSLTTRFVKCPALVPLTKQESTSYIQQCLVHNGAQLEAIFTPGAVKCLVAHGQGNPRTLNTLCTRVLHVGAQLHEQPISAATTQKIIVGRQQKRIVPLLRRTPVARLGLALVLGLGLMTVLYRSLRETQDGAVSSVHSPATLAPSPAADIAPLREVLPVDSQTGSIPTPGQIVTLQRTPPIAALESASQAAQSLATPEPPLPAPRAAASGAPAATDNACLLNMLQGKPCQPEATPAQPPPLHQGKPRQP